MPPPPPEGEGSASGRAAGTGPLGGWTSCIPGWRGGGQAPWHQPSRRCVSPRHPPSSGVAGRPRGSSWSSLDGHRDSTEARVQRGVSSAVWPELVGRLFTPSASPRASVRRALAHTGQSGEGAGCGVPVPSRPRGCSCVEGKVAWLGHSARACVPTLSLCRTRGAGGEAGACHFPLSAEGLCSL